MGFSSGSDDKESAVLGLIPGSGRSPGEGMATYSSILAWKIPWTEEPGRLVHGVHKESDIRAIIATLLL